MLRVLFVVVTFFLASATGMTPERSGAPVGWMKAAAQDQKPGVTAPGKAEPEKRGEEGKETEETQTPDEPTDKEISGAERVFRFDNRIKADRRTVDELQAQLKTRVEVYDAAAERMELAGELRRDPEFGGYILDEPNMLGVDDFGNAAFRVKFVMKTRPDKMWPVRREMLRRIKNKFDELGIRIPVQHHVVLQRNTKGVEE
jgi:hypothetical protein